MEGDFAGSEIEENRMVNVVNCETILKESTSELAN